MADIFINNSMVIFMDLKNMNQQNQTEKLTHAITVRVTEDDYIRYSMLSAEGKSNIKSVYIREIRREYHLHSFDPDNPPPLKTNNEA